MSRPEVEGFARPGSDRLAFQIQHLSADYADNSSAKATTEFFRLASVDPNSAAARIGQILRGVTEPDPYNIGQGGWQDLIINGFGYIYPSLDKPNREIGLKGVLSYLDTVTNYMEAQEVVAQINDPWLVGDIYVNRGLYWPGYTTIGDQTWEQFQEMIDSSKSAFWLSYAVLRIDHDPAPEEVRKRFQETYPELVDRTSDAIAAMTYGSAARDHKRNPEVSIEDAAEKRITERFDPVLHDSIRAKIQEGKFVIISDNH